VALISYSQDAAAIRNTWATLSGRDVGWLASEGIFGDFVQRLGDKKLAQGMVITAPVFDPDGPENDAFNVAYMANYDMPPLAYSAQEYDAAALLMLAIAKAGSLEGSKIRDALFDVSAPGPQKNEVTVTPGALGDGLVAIAQGMGVNYEGASGPVDFEDFGNVRSDYELYRWADDGSPERLGLVHAKQKMPCP
jgi:ABC-type branched-subunit amino acid transport system substrate-binding protein